MTEQKGKGYQGIWATETFEYKNTRKISIIVITEKSENLSQTTGLPGTQGAFSDR